MTLPQHPDFEGIEVPEEIRERFFAVLKQEHDAANERVARVVRGQFTQICSYCGAFEAPADGGWEALQQHVAECPTHPLAKANAEIARLEKALGDLYWHLTNGKLSKPYDFKAIESAIDDEITELVNKEKAELTDLVLAAMDDPPRPPKDAGNWEERARRAVG